MAVAASPRSSLVGALLRTSLPSRRHSIVDFLRGLSRDELECVADFQGACALESMEFSALSPYDLLPRFFDSSRFDRWKNAEERAHKTFIILEWLEHSASGQLSLKFQAF